LTIKIIVLIFAVLFHTTINIMYKSVRRTKDTITSKLFNSFEEAVGFLEGFVQTTERKAEEIDYRNAQSKWGMVIELKQLINVKYFQ
jgi:hypothetical protein